NDRHAGLLRQFAGGVLVAQVLHRGFRRADKLDPRDPALVCEVGLLGQESISGVNGIDVGKLRSADDSVDAKVALSRWSRSDADPLVGKFQIWCAAVGLTIDRNRFDPQIVTGPDHPQSDLTAIGN